MDKQLSIIYKKTSEVVPYENNARWNDKAIDAVASSIKEYGFKNPILIDKDNVIIAGHTRLKAAQKLNIEKVPCIYADDLTPQQIKAFRIADNKTGEIADWNFDLLEQELQELLNGGYDISSIGFNDAELDEIIAKTVEDMDYYLDLRNGYDADDEEQEEKPATQEKQNLADMFGVPPFSVIDTCRGYWQDRKRMWLDFGVKSELGRKENMMNASKTPDYADIKLEHIAPSTSIFDPVLCEIMYKWFNIEKGDILDPFAGGSVRGIVAHKLGFNYWGNDLRQEQIDANYENAKTVIPENIPHWTCGDSVNIIDIMQSKKFDMIFSCPPYADLEVYSDLENDISNMEYEDFLSAYRNIIKNSCSLLKDNRFAVFVVGDVRDKKGFYRDFISHTKQAFIDCGCNLYNEIIKVDPLGTAALRAGHTFKTRKIVKVHQNILVFYKGNIKDIKENYKDIEFEEIE